MDRVESAGRMARGGEESVSARGAETTAAAGQFILKAPTVPFFTSDVDRF
jgi:hypothetical protein